MRMVMHSFQTPRWVAPILVLIAVALIPFALILALVLAGLALGVSALRFFLSGAARDDSGPVLRRDTASRRISNSSVIDADFEVKNEEENTHRQETKNAKKNF